VNLEWVRKEKFNIELILVNDNFDYSKCINTLNNKKDIYPLLFNKWINCIIMLITLKAITLYR